MDIYKQKYEEALERAKTLHKLACETQYDNTRLAVEELFPELKESEDEEIRNEIIQSIQDNMCVIHKDKCIAWLEKQDKIIDEYEDKLDRCACKSFDKGYKAALEKQGKQKPAWSEEDEKMLHEISQCVYDNVVNIGTVNKVRYIDWLKSLKERMKGE